MRITALLIFLQISSSLAGSFFVSMDNRRRAAIDSGFYGIQYHAHVFDAEEAQTKLTPLRLKYVRIWARPDQFHPDSATWQWTDLDTRISEVRQAGYQPLVCLYQSEEWWGATADDPWWNHPRFVEEWEKCASQLALRYRRQVAGFIIFDEINILHPDKGYYISPKGAADLYLRAARQIKQIDSTLLCGGPSNFGGWENGYWANLVLQETDGAQMLDFVSSNLFLSWNADDPDSLLLNRTLWYEEAPQKIKEMLGEKTPLLMLDAYNVSALWQKDGVLWTDPRNTNFFGGIYQALALLHAAQGGFSITLHWETLGGYGIFDWYPQFNPLPPYFAWNFVEEVAGLQFGAQVLSFSTDQPIKQNVQHHGGMNAPSYRVQPFVVRAPDGTLRCCLINKSTTHVDTARILTPDSVKSIRIFRYDSLRADAQSYVPLSTAPAADTTVVLCPPMSVTVVSFSTQEPIGIFGAEKRALPQKGVVHIRPNPFNAQARIVYRLPFSTSVILEIFDVRGKRILRKSTERETAGTHSITLQAAHWASGVYFVRLRSPMGWFAHSKFVLLK